MNERRLDELTALRGIAAICVVVLHASYEWHPIFRTGERFTNIVLAGGIWVHFFFVLSGFVISHAYANRFVGSIRLRSYLRFVWVRFGRIYPLYFVLLLAWVAARRLGWIPVSDPGASLLMSFFLMQGFIYGDDVWNYPGWSISAEWFAYLVFPFLAALLAGRSNRVCRRGAITIVAGIVVLFGFGFSVGEMPPMALVYCLLEFTLGCLIHRFASTDDITRSCCKGKATVICMLPLLLIALPPNRWTGWITGIAAAGCGSTILLVATRPTYFEALLRTRSLQFLGMISYSIYLNHAFLFRAIKAIANAWTGRARTIETLAPGAALLAFCGYAGILLVVSWMTYRTIEEPVRLWFKRVASQSPDLSG